MKTVLITGAARGIGQAIARTFAENGYNVAINYYQSAAQAAELAAELNARRADSAAVFAANVAVAAEVRAMVAAVEQHFGEISVLVNNAGIGSQKLFTEVSEAEWDAIFDVNLKGAFHCCQAVLPPMITRKSGKIINISSIWGICGASCEVAYSAAKAGLIGLTRALALEVAPSNIQVNCVAPGVIDTEMNALHSAQTMADLAEQTPCGRIGSGADVASAVLYLASEQADFMVGQVLSPNGGLVIG